MKNIIYIATILTILLIPSYSNAEDVNYNYLTDTTEKLVVPLIFKDSVASLSNLASLAYKQDGGVRKVESTGLVYQYSITSDDWNNISKSVSGSTNSFISLNDTPTAHLNKSYLASVDNQVVYKKDKAYHYDKQFDICPRTFLNTSDIYWYSVFKFDSAGDLIPR